MIKKLIAISSLISLLAASANATEALIEEAALYDGPEVGESYGHPEDDIWQFLDPLTPDLEEETKTYKNPWFSAIPRKKMGPSQSFGKYSAGCIDDAQAVEDQTGRMMMMRLQRRRNFVHDKAFAVLNKMANYTNTTFGSQLMVGDLGQPMGGPIFYPLTYGFSPAHLSHQSGLDMDIWYVQSDKKHFIQHDERASMAAVNMADRKNRSVTKAWKPEYLATLLFTAKLPEVAKILIDPSIKNYLCTTLKGTPEQSLLKKFRPVAAHNYHFHVRVKCPAEDKSCRTDITPEDEACNLGRFFPPIKAPVKPRPPVGTPPKPKPPKPPKALQTLPALPVSCSTMIKN